MSATSCGMITGALLLIGCGKDTSQAVHTPEPPPPSCHGSNACETAGLCTPKDGACIAGSDGDCKQSERCGVVGECTAREGVCRVGSNADCRATKLCLSEGWCSRVESDGESSCAASKNTDCRQSDACTGELRSSARCRAVNGVCVH